MGIFVDFRDKSQSLDRQLKINNSSCFGRFGDFLRLGRARDPPAGLANWRHKPSQIRSTII
jgi:hypothetical protein